ncbi:MAG: hypothetical protein HRT45_10230 [Bdellovibrionales bacterium]|nr:hypothetical protein [Bdellovibrionales bacterium]
MTLKALAPVLVLSLTACTLKQRRNPDYGTYRTIDCEGVTTASDELSQQGFSQASKPMQINFNYFLLNEAHRQKDSKPTYTSGELIQFKYPDLELERGLPLTGEIHQSAKGSYFELFSQFDYIKLFVAAPASKSFSSYTVVGKTYPMACK